MKPSDKKLDDVLKSARVPERHAEYWEEFPGRVTSYVERSPSVAAAHVFRPRVSWIFATATAAGIALLAVWLWPRVPSDTQSASQTELPEPAKMYREMAALFPERLQAIVADERGVRLVLAAEPIKPSSPPLFLKICGRSGCHEMITFSGQQVRVNGESCDVLLDGRGNVIVVGARMFWSSAELGARPRDVRIKAERLAS